MKQRIIIIVLFIFVGIFECTAQSQPPVAEKGVLDLRGYNFENNVEIKGEWEFYSGRFLNYFDFVNRVYTPDAYLQIPQNWADIEKNGQQLPDTGFATFRLVVFVDTTSKENFLMYFGEVFSAYRVWWNSDTIVQLGTIAQKSKNEIPATTPTFKAVRFDQEKIELIVQISNFHHKKNGFFKAPVLGKEKNIIRAKNFDFLHDIFFFGIFIVLALFNLLFYFSSQKNKATIGLVIIGFATAFYIIFSNNFIVSYAFANISWRLVYTINYLSYLLIIGGFGLYSQGMLAEKKYKWFYYSNYTLLLIVALILIAPIIYFSRILPICHIIMLLSILLFMFLTIKNTINKQKGAFLQLLFTTVFLLTFANDILLNYRLLQTTPLFVYGSLTIILIQSIISTFQFGKKSKKNANSLEKLTELNKNLEADNNKKARKIEIQKRSIKEKENKLIDQEEEIKNYSSNIGNDKKVLNSQKSFDYAYSIQKSLLPTKEEIQKYFNSFLIYIPKDVVSGDFYWLNDSNEKYVYYVVGDCSGHGLAGAFLSISVMYLLNSIINEKKITDPKEILTMLNKIFVEFMEKGNNSHRDGVVLGIMRFEKTNLTKLTYASAKLNLFLYNSEYHKVKRFKGTRREISYKVETINESEFENITIDLSENDIIYCMSDGYMRQNDSLRKSFGTNKFIETIKRNSKLPLLQQKIAFTNELFSYKGSQALRDDVTLVGLKIKPN